MRCEAIALTDVRCQRRAQASPFEVDHHRRYLCHVHHRMLLVYPKNLKFRP